MLTKVGPDSFGEFVREALVGFGVDPAYVGTAPGLLTPVVFCELDPPEDPALFFYRQPIAPDLTIDDDDIPWDVVRDVPVFWVTGTGASVEPSRTSQLAMLKHRGRLDPGLGPAHGARPGLATDVLVVARAGHAPSTTPCSTTSRWPSATVPRSRWRSAPAIRTRRPPACSTGVVELALVKMGGEGVLVATPDSRDVVAPHPVEVVCGLGAGDAFGGALVHGLLSGWEPVRIARYANAAGAIVASRLACADAMPTLDELTRLVDSEEGAS